MDEVYHRAGLGRFFPHMIVYIAVIVICLLAVILGAGVLLIEQSNIGHE